ncbi:DUF6457 domain-containing protein [Propionibacterium freudenreichii]|uniref:DUF6457 domain-containing protein n=1 Tax=Propionibacterium freudenreichii TaxID=1744 RepID=UPI0023EA5B16|nr:DUF6457 domain-containing protein [Propionibacterium freudenreichii]
MAAVAGELGLDDGLPAEAEKPVLDLISQVAHGPSRPGAPLTAFLVGVAVGRGDSLEDQTAAISRLVARFGA